MCMHTYTYMPVNSVRVYQILIHHSNRIRYHMAQNFDGENIDEFDECPAIHQYFPVKIFHLVS